MRTSAEGVAFIKSFESFSGTPYLCPAGVPTIGYGITRYPNGRRVSLSDPAIDEGAAGALLRTILADVERAVSDLVDVPLSQGEFDALVSFAMNVGTDIDEDAIAEGLGDSTLLRKLNAGDYEGAASEFAKWNKSKGRVLAGLTRRRAAEARMFRGTLA